MKVDISKIEFEESYIDTDGNIVLYFIAPKELVSDKFPEAEHSTISIIYHAYDKDLDNCFTEISPTTDGLDYEWSLIDLEKDDIRQLISKSAKKNPIAEAYRILLNEIKQSDNDVAYIIDPNAIQEAIGYLGEVLE